MKKQQSNVALNDDLLGRFPSHLMFGPVPGLQGAEGPIQLATARRPLSDGLPLVIKLVQSALGGVCVTCHGQSL